MIEGGADIARLGLELDGREFIATGERSAATLDHLAERGDAATARLRELERAQRDTASSSAAAAQAQQSMAEKVEAARMRFVGIQRVFEEDMAQIRELQIRGFLSPEDAREAGRIAAAEYNAGVLSALDEAGPNAMGTGDGVELWTKMAKSLKDVDTQTKATSGGLGRLNQTLTSTLRQVAGLNPVTAQLASTLGGLALSGVVMTGALAGLAALGLAYRKLTEDARESARANREALDRLQQLRETAALGPLGRTGADVETGQGGLERLEAQREELRRDLEQAVRQGRDSAVQLLQDRIRALDEAYREAGATVRFGEEEIRRISEEAYRDEVSREAQRLASLVSAGEATIQERQRLIALRDSMRFALSESDDPGVRSDALGVIEQANAALGEQATAVDRVVASETDRVRLLQEGLELNVLSGAELLELLQVAEDLRAELARGNQTLEERIEITRRLRDLDAQLAESWEARGQIARSGVTVQGLDLELGMIGKITTASTELAQRQIDARNAGKKGAMEFEDAWVAAIQVAGSHMGGFASQVANVAGAAATGGPWAAAAASTPLVLDILFGDDSAEKARAAAEAQKRYNEALEDFTGMFLGQTLIEEQLERVEEGFESAARAAAEAAGYQVRDWEEALGRSAEFWRQVAADSEGWDHLRARLQFAGEMEKLVAELERVREAARAQVAAEREAEEENLQVRLLRAQGLDREADALQSSLEFERQRQEAIEKDGEESAAILEFLDAIEAATAARREENRAFRESQNNLSLDEREAILDGDDRAAAVARARARAEAERRAAEEALKAGEISEEGFNRWIDIIGREFLDSIGDVDDAIRRQAQANREAAQAAREAAEAERLRMLEVHQRLEIEALQLSGQDDAARAMQNQMEMDALMRDGASAATLALLGHVQALRAQAEAQEEARRGADDLTRSFAAMGSTANVPQFQWDFLRARAAQSVGAPPMTARMTIGSGAVQTFNIQIVGSDKSAGQLLDEVQREAARRAQNGDQSNFRSLEFN